MTKNILLAGFAILGLAQAQDVILKIVGGEKPSIAVPDFRGAGDSAPYMSASISRHHRGRRPAPSAC